MVAAFVAGGHPAFEVGQGAVEQRHAESAQGVGYPFELLNAFGGKTGREFFLFKRQEVDRKDLGFLEAGVAVDGFVNADQQQRGVERQRAEGVSGQAEGFVGFVLGGDDGHAGGKVPHGVAQLAWIDSHAALLGVWSCFLTATRGTRTRQLRPSRSGTG